MSSVDSAPSTTPAVRGRAIVALLAAGVISLSGNQLTALAIPWFVLRTTGSAKLLGLTGFVQSVSFIVAALLGGVVVDRLGFRRASVLSDLGAGLAIAAIPLLHATLGLAFWQLLVLVFTATFLNIPGGAARRSMLPELATQVGGLERVNAFDQGAANAATLAGPLIAGVLIATLTAANVLWLDAASFLLSALLIGAFLPPFSPAQAPGAFRTALRQGLSFIWRERVVRAVALIGTWANAVGIALFGVVLPVYAARVLDSAVGLGVLAAADGGGALLGTVVYGLVGPRLPKRATLLIAFSVSVASLAALALTPPLPWTVLVLALDGMAFGVIGPLMYTIYQERIPAELRGRVFGALMAVHRLATPLGAAGAGLLLGSLSIESALAGIAALSLLMPLAILLTPAMREA